MGEAYENNDGMNTRLKAIDRATVFVATVGAGLGPEPHLARFVFGSGVEDMEWRPQSCGKARAEL